MSKPSGTADSQRRVFVRRRTRSTNAQTRGLTELDQNLLQESDLSSAYDSQQPIFLEIGFGNGVALADFAVKNPNWLCIGVEVFEPGIGSLVNRIREFELKNVRIKVSEGLTFIESMAYHSINLLWLLFPDPWPKKRHHKRRLINSQFVETLEQKLAIGGEIRIATDWIDYADVIEFEFGRSNLFNGERISAGLGRATTKYEERGNRLGHEVSEFVFQRSE